MSKCIQILCFGSQLPPLPPSITEIVLCLLPIEEAARTSILSRAWRYQWTKIPKLVFSEIQFQKSTNGAESPVSEQTSHRQSKRQKLFKRFKFFNAIYQSLLMHEGPIHEFCLTMQVDISCTEVDNILLHLSKKKTVKKLTLDLAGRYKLPSTFFSLDRLTNLFLVGCALYLPPQFGGFGSLTCLHLNLVWASEETLLLLLSGCPLLKRLKLDEHVIISSSGESTSGDFFKCLPAIEDLSILFPIFLCFIPDRLPKEFPITLVHLKCFCMKELCFTHKCSFPFLDLLIRSSPNLEKLTLEVLEETLFDEDEICAFTLKDHSDLMLEHLNEFKISSHFKITKHELDFVKLILAKSPALKNAKIVVIESQDEESHDEESQGEESHDEESHDEESHDEELQTWQISEILSSCPRASPIAKLSIELVDRLLIDILFGSNM